MEQEIEDNLSDHDFAFNEPDPPIVKVNGPESDINNNDEHHVSQSIELSNSDNVEYDSLEPTYKEVDDKQFHPLGRPVREVAGKGRPMDDQFL